MSVGSRINLRHEEKREIRAIEGTSARRHSTRASFDVAEVAKRPKKRPGRRERSSMTTRLQAMLV
jgi:hypothetical protein